MDLLIQVLLLLVFVIVAVSSTWTRSARQSEAGQAQRKEDAVTEETSLYPPIPDYAKLSGVSAPEPYHDFDITKAVARPYRPFRWKYHQTMALTRLQANWWIELESTYKERLKQRLQIHRDRGSDMMQMLPGSEAACRELMQMVVQFVCARYPHYFSLDAEQVMFHNHITCQKTNIRETLPLHVLLEHVPEDFVVMIKDVHSGYYYFRAGIICSSVGWNLAEKIGKRLEDIHAGIPDYREKMAFSMDRYFSKMSSASPIQRGSWGFELDQPLYLPPGEAHSGMDGMPIENARSRIHLRVDWQTLRRMPVSGAIAFNFKALFTPLEQLRHEAFIPALALKVLKEGKKEILDYKGIYRTARFVVPALEEFAAEQVTKSIVPGDWDVCTLDESPFFPGWRLQWLQAQQ